VIRNEVSRQEAKTQRRFAAILPGVLCVCVVACSSPPAAPPQEAAPPAPPAARVLDHDGHLAFRLVRDRKGHTVYDGEDTLLVRLKDQPDHILVEDEKRPLLRIKRQIEKPQSWLVENMSAARQFVYTGRDGGYEITNAAGKPLYALRRSGEGYEVLDEKNKVACRLARANGLVTVTRADGFKLYEVHGGKSLAAPSALVLDKFNITARAALLAFLSQLEEGKTVP
jgi:hypothetical protein